MSTLCKLCHMLKSQNRNICYCVSGLVEQTSSNEAANHIVSHRATMENQHRDNGSATVVGIGMVVAVGLLISMLLTIALVMRAGATARTAADFAAIAAAQHYTFDLGDPCEIAGNMSEANHAQLVSCTVEGTDAMVRVRVPTHMPIVAYAYADARAGPVDCE